MLQSQSQTVESSSNSSNALFVLFTIHSPSTVLTSTQILSQTTDSPKTKRKNKAKNKKEEWTENPFTLFMNQLKKTKTKQNQGFEG